MQTQHLLLLSSIALSSPALAEEAKPAANADGKPKVEVEAVSRADAARGAAANDETIRIRPAPKNRVRQTFPPSVKRM